MKEAIRIYILEKAKQLFIKQGYRQSTMAEIAEASGVSKPTLYRYFAGKEDLIRSVAEELEAFLGREVFSILERKAPFKEKFQAFIERTFALIMENRELYRLAALEYWSGGKIFHEKEAFIEKFSQAKKERYDKVRAFVREGQKEGVLREELSDTLMTFMIMAVFTEFFHLVVLLTPASGFRPEEVGRQVYSALEEGLFRR